MTLVSCNTSSLAIYVPSAEKPWNQRRVNHVYRRLGFGLDQDSINAALNLTPENLIDELINEAVNLPTTSAPSWANQTYSYYINNGLDFDEETQNNHNEWRLQAMDDLINDGLRGRIVLFWHNHFVTELESYYCSNYLYRYYNLLQTYCLGDFKQFVREIGLNEAMLLYLNGFENTSAEPNENYARELFELFTLGVDNGYTQQDIVETSRALTGYNHWDDFCDSIYFAPTTFDSSDKTIFGQVGNWDYNDVIDILFDQKGSLIAKFICTKIYKYFVSPNINESIVDDLASTFETDFNIANVLTRLFKSEHFFADEAIGTIIKSPYDLTINFLLTTKFTINEEDMGTVFYYNVLAGQELFNPVDVAGWQGDRDWINSSTLGGRWTALENFIWYTWNNDREKLRDFALETSDYSNDPAFITKSIIDRFAPNELHTVTDYTVATDIFKAEIPQNYYDDGSWNLNWDSAPYQVVLLLLHMVKIPEFQLK
jgi:uncharacterized protein (DUF1800 family)